MWNLRAAYFGFLLIIGHIIFLLFAATQNWTCLGPNLYIDALWYISAFITALISIHLLQPFRTDTPCKPGGMIFATICQCTLLVIYLMITLIPHVCAFPFPTHWIVIGVFQAVHLMVSFYGLCFEHCPRRQDYHLQHDTGFA